MNCIYWIAQKLSSRYLVSKMSSTLAKDSDSHLVGARNFFMASCFTIWVCVFLTTANSEQRVESKNAKFVM